MVTNADYGFAYDGGVGRGENREIMRKQQN